MTPSLILSPRWRRAVSVGALLALLGACGGGTGQIDPFIADRVIAFGDETSVLTGAGPQPEFEPGGPLGSDGAAGRKYSVNARNGAGVAACDFEPIWVQTVASQYALVFAECNPSAVANPKALMYARVGAKAADLQGQIDALVAAGGIVAKDLVTVLIGANDVLELYRQFPARSEAELTDELKRRGEVTAAQVNRLVNLGARVLLATVPDLGLSPYALAEKAAHTDTDRAALLTRLTAAYNVRMRVGIVNDGRFIGLVLADEMVQAIVKVPSAFAINDVVTAICTTALPDCTPSTLVTDKASVTSLWADGTRMAYGGHLRLGALAVSRATGNPF